MPAQRLAPDPLAPASSDTATIRIEENKKEIPSPQKTCPDEPVRLAVSPVTTSPNKGVPPPPPNIPRTSLIINTPPSQRASLSSTQPSLISAPPSPRVGPPPSPSAPGSDGSGPGKHAIFLISSEGESFEVTVFQPQHKSIMKRTAKVIEDSDGELEIVPEDPPPPIGPPGPRKRVGFPEDVVTGELEPEEDDDLSDVKSSEWGAGASVDLRGQNIGDLRDSGETLDPAAMRAGWRDRQRLRGSANGRNFQEKAEKQEIHKEMTPQEKEFAEETARLLRNSDQLEVDVYALNQDIREKQKELEAKKRQLAELLILIKARPYQWAKILDPNAPDPPVEKPLEPNGIEKRPRGSLKELESDPQIVRVHVQKLGTLFSKDGKRVLELNQLIKIISLHKLKKDSRTEVIHAHQIHSCKAPDKNSPILNFKYYGDSDRKLLRTQKDLKLKFETIFERERIWRVLREMLPTEKRASTFTYIPQPLPISEKTQERVNDLPIYKLAAVLHDAWIERKESMGWKHGLNQDDIEKTHPQMKEFEKLTTEDQKFCINIATLTLAGIFELGYAITKAQGNQKGYAPQLRSLIEFLAEDAHESWADVKIKSGWRHDVRMDSAAKLHPDLVPYCDLDENAKEPDREAALTVISNLIKWGFCITKNSGDFDTEPS